MIQTINRHQFQDTFKAIRPDNFSYDGLNALFDFFEEYDEYQNMELDVIAICCEFTEYENLEEVQQNYTNIESIEDLHDHTMVIEFNTGLIIQDY